MAGVTWWNFYFRLFPGTIRSPQVIEFLGALAAPHSRQAADRLGRIDWPSQPHDLGVHPPAARAVVGGVSSRLCPGAESGRVPVVALEATRTAELLPAELWPVKPLCPQGPAPDAEAPYARHCLLAAGGAVSVVTILCNAQ